ncbi:hypothetical protein [Kitasatospora sp. NPDC093806]|uniref:hypothetical protein n=1 Tax=Kitasatospora sp. NPDC093806 TaxID=3155075 RepID=UPI00343F87AD
MNSRTLTTKALLALAAVGLTAVAGCADAGSVEPSTQAFAFEGKKLDVNSRVPTDLVASDRKDVLVTLWFDEGHSLGSRHVEQKLDGERLDLAAGCTGFADCDVRFRVEVPRGVTVLRNGNATDLKG